MFYAVFYLFIFYIWWYNTRCDIQAGFFTEQNSSQFQQALKIPVFLIW